VSDPTEDGTGYDLMKLPWPAGRRDHHDDFVAYYAARGTQLRNTAYLLCRDWHLAEDLTQVTFTKLYRCWHRIERHEALDQYAHLPVPAGPAGHRAGAGNPVAGTAVSTRPWYAAPRRWCAT